MFAMLVTGIELGIGLRKLVLTSSEPRDRIHPTVYMIAATCGRQETLQQIHTYIHAYIHTYTHTHIHTYTHTHIHTYIH